MYKLLHIFPSPALDSLIDVNPFQWKKDVLVEDKVKIISLISCKFVVASDCNRNMVNIGRNHGQEQWGATKTTGINDSVKNIGASSASINPIC
jgi:hypothetical protein